MGVYKSKDKNVLCNKPKGAAMPQNVGFKQPLPGATNLPSLMLLLRCSFHWYPFWPNSKFSDLGQKPWTIIRRFCRNRGDFSAVLLLHSGRCYGAEICVILFLLRCPFIWYPFWPKSKFSDFGQKPWTIIRRFCRNRGDFLRSFYSTVEGATELKFASFCSS